MQIPPKALAKKGVQLRHEEGSGGPALCVRPFATLDL
jgi:hypothetical protein